ncbi:hypothetical protein [Halomarina rubra]|uniref:Crp/Fnr family transcriptional regulator n=1 Tax=Halomarina rubra TaxID=2071873 RepID=A0ABD6AWN9_9EURY|nr:hypothetical protein [Halomarina rubra]
MPTNGYEVHCRECDFLSTCSNGDLARLLAFSHRERTGHETEFSVAGGE